MRTLTASRELAARRVRKRAKSQNLCLTFATANRTELERTAVNRTALVEAATDGLLALGCEQALDRILDRTERPEPGLTGSKRPLEGRYPPGTELGS